MVRGLTVNQVYDVKVYERSSRSCRANKNVMAVVSWWWNHLKNLRCIEEPGLPRRFWEPKIAGSNPAAPIQPVGR